MRGCLGIQSARLGAAHETANRGSGRRDRPYEIVAVYLQSTIGSWQHRRVETQADETVMASSRTGWHVSQQRLGAVYLEDFFHKNSHLIV